jgi:hypothetical protein
LQCCHMCLCLL